MVALAQEKKVEKLKFHPTNIEQLFAIAVSQIALQIDFFSFCKGENWDTEREGGLPEVLQQAKGRGPSRSPFSAAWFCHLSTSTMVLISDLVISGKQKSSSESINQP